MHNLLEMCEEIAREAHAGQTYGDRDYVTAHIIPVTQLIRRMGYDENYQAVGWLHDTPEDSEITVDELRQRGVPEQITSAVDLLTKKGEPHEQYLGRIATNPLAVVCKFADSSLNLANTILNPAGIDEARFQRWLRTYTGNLSFLLPLLPQGDLSGN